MTSENVSDLFQVVIGKQINLVKEGVLFSVPESAMLKHRLVKNVSTSTIAEGVESIVSVQLMLADAQQALAARQKEIELLLSEKEEASKREAILIGRLHNRSKVISKLRATLYADLTALREHIATLESSQGHNYPVSVQQFSYLQVFDLLERNPFGFDESALEDCLGNFSRNQANSASSRCSSSLAHGDGTNDSSVVSEDSVTKTATQALEELKLKFEREKKAIRLVEQEKHASTVAKLQELEARFITACKIQQECEARLKEAREYSEKKLKDGLSIATATTEQHLQQHYSRTERIIEDLELRISDFQMKNEDLEKQLESAKAILKRFEQSSKAGAVKRIGELEDNLKTLHLTISSRDDDIEKLKSNTTAAESRAAFLDRAVKSSQDRYETLEAELQSQKDSFTVKMSLLAKENQLLSGKISELEGQCVRMNTDFKEERERIKRAALDEARLQLGDSAEQWKDEAEVATRKLSELQSKLAALQASLRESESACLEYQNEMEKMSVELGMEKTAHEMVRTRIDKEVRSLQYTKDRVRPMLEYLDKTLVENLPALQTFIEWCDRAIFSRLPPEAWTSLNLQLPQGDSLTIESFAEAVNSSNNNNGDVNHEEEEDKSKVTSSSRHKNQPKKIPSSKFGSIVDAVAFGLNHCRQAVRRMEMGEKVLLSTFTEVKNPITQGSRAGGAFLTSSPESTGPSKSPRLGGGGNLQLSIAQSNSNNVRLLRKLPQIATAQPSEAQITTNAAESTSLTTSTVHPQLVSLLRAEYGVLSEDDVQFVADCDKLATASVTKDLGILRKNLEEVRRNVPIVKDVLRSPLGRENAHSSSFQVPQLHAAALNSMSVETQTDPLIIESDLSMMTLQQPTTATTVSSPKGPKSPLFPTGSKTLSQKSSGKLSNRNLNGPTTGVSPGVSPRLGTKISTTKSGAITIIDDIHPQQQQQQSEGEPVLPPLGIVTPPTRSLQDAAVQSDPLIVVVERVPLGRAVECQTDRTAPPAADDPQKKDTAHHPSNSRGVSKSPGVEGALTPRTERRSAKASKVLVDVATQSSVEPQHKQTEAGKGTSSSESTVPAAPLGVEGFQAAFGQFVNELNLVSPQDQRQIAGPYFTAHLTDEDVQRAWATFNQPTQRKTPAIEIFLRCFSTLLPLRKYQSHLIIPQETSQPSQQVDKVSRMTATSRPPSSTGPRILAEHVVASSGTTTTAMTVSSKQCVEALETLKDTVARIAQSVVSSPANASASDLGASWVAPLAEGFLLPMMSYLDERLKAGRYTLAPFNDCTLSGKFSVPQLAPIVNEAHRSVQSLLCFTKESLELLLQITNVFVVRPLIHALSSVITAQEIYPQCLHSGMDDGEVASRHPSPSTPIGTSRLKVSSGMLARKHREHIVHLLRDQQPQQNASAYSVSGSADFVVRNHTNAAPEEAVLPQSKTHQPKLCARNFRPSSAPLSSPVNQGRTDSPPLVNDVLHTTKFPTKEHVLQMRSAQQQQQHGNGVSPHHAQQRESSDSLHFAKLDPTGGGKFDPFFVLQRDEKQQQEKERPKTSPANRKALGVAENATNSSESFETIPIVSSQRAPTIHTGVAPIARGTAASVEPRFCSLQRTDGSSQNKQVAPAAWSNVGESFRNKRTTKPHPASNDVKPGAMIDKEFLVIFNAQDSVEGSNSKVVGELKKDNNDAPTEVRCTSDKPALLHRPLSATSQTGKTEKRRIGAMRVSSAGQKRPSSGNACAKVSGDGSSIPPQSLSMDISFCNVLGQAIGPVAENLFPTPSGSIGSLLSVPPAQFALAGNSSKSKGATKNFLWEGTTKGVV